MAASGSPEPARSGAPPRSSASIRRRLFAVSGIVIGVTGVVLGLLFVFQRSLIYLPDESDPPRAAAVLERGEDVTLRTSDGLDLGAYLALPEPSVDRNVAVLAAPGNAGNRGGRADFADELTSRGFTVLVLDYRGYGGNPGSPTQDGLHADGVAAVEFLTGAGFDLDRIVYFGESLGTGVVSGLLADYPPAAVVLRSPFTDLPALADHTIPLIPVGWLVTDEYPVLDQVVATEVPVVVIRGTDDEVVPTGRSAQVAGRAPTLLEEVVFPGAGHNDPIMFGPQVAEVVQRTADRVQTD